MVGMSLPGEGALTIWTMTRCQQCLLPGFGIDAVQFSVERVSHDPFPISTAVAVPEAAFLNLAVVCMFVGSYVEGENAGGILP